MKAKVGIAALVAAGLLGGYLWSEKRDEAKAAAFRAAHEETQHLLRELEYQNEDMQRDLKNQLKQLRYQIEELEEALNKR